MVNNIFLYKLLIGVKKINGHSGVNFSFKFLTTHVAEVMVVYFPSSQVGSLLSIEGTLHIRDPKSKSWKQSHVCLKNGYMSVNKERGVKHFSLYRQVCSF